jgi:hypothetical protein
VPTPRSMLPALALAAVTAGCSSSSSPAPSNDGGSRDAPGASDGPSADGAASDAGATSITLGPAEQILMPGQLGLDSVPDEQLSLIRQPDGSYLAWIGGTVSGCNGCTALLSTTDFSTFASVVGDGGAATSVFGASAQMPCGNGIPGSSAFDAQYAAPGTVFPAANGSDLLILYHAENHTFAGSCYKVLPFYASIGLARSSDGGRTWVRQQGPVVSGRDPHPAAAPSMNAGWGAAVPSAVVDGGFIYVFYSDYPVPSSGHESSNSIMVARAPTSSDGAAGSWQKWLNGSFSSPGAGGDSTPPVPLAGSSCVFPRQPGVSFNAHLNRYLLTMVCGAGWYFSLATDLTKQDWSVPAQFFAAPYDNQSLLPGDEYDWHAALVTPGQPSGQSTDASGYVLYARGGYPNTPIHMLWRRAFTIAP